MRHDELGGAVERETGLVAQPASVKCKERVYPAGRFGSFHPHTCYRNARPGSDWCKQHDPETKRERRNAAHERWNAKHRQWQQGVDDKVAGRALREAGITVAQAIEAVSYMKTAMEAQT